MSVQFDNFIIHIRPFGEDHYQVYTESKHSGESETITLSRLEFARWVQQGREIRSKIVTLDIVQQYGKDMFETIFQKSLLKSYVAALAVADNQSSGLRIVFHFAECLELQEIIWETLHDGRDFLAINPQTPIARYIRQAAPVRSREQKPPLRVLFTTACPPNLPSLNLTAEEDNLRQVLQATGDRLQLVVERNISLGRLHHVLLRAEHTDHPFHIWHHAGHGEMVDNKFALMLEEGGQAQSIDLTQIEPIAAVCRNLMMVVLNVCHAAAPHGLAVRLAQVNVPIVIGFHNAVLDRHALIFARELYATLLDAPLEMAVGRVRNRLYAENQANGGLDWLLPILFSRSTETTFLAESPPAQQFLPIIPSSRLPSGPKFTINARNIEADNLMVTQTINVGQHSPFIENNAEMTLNVEESIKARNIKTAQEANFSDAEALAAFDALINQVRQSDKPDIQS